MTDNALDRAGFYVEELKYGTGPRRLEPYGAEELASALEVLLRDADVTSISGRELAEASRFYADSWSELVGVSPLLARSIFVDGVMHGVALAAGLESTRERLDEIEKEHQ